MAGGFDVVMVIFFFFDGYRFELVEVAHAGFLGLERVLLLLQNLEIKREGVKRLFIDYSASLQGLFFL